jgi:hypothetical protein
MIVENYFYARISRESERDENCSELNDATGKMCFWPRRIDLKMQHRKKNLLTFQHSHLRHSEYLNYSNAFSTRERCASRYCTQAKYSKKRKRGCDVKSDTWNIIQFLIPSFRGTPVDVGVNFMVYDLHVIFGLLFT